MDDNLFVVHGFAPALRRQPCGDYLDIAVRDAYTASSTTGANVARETRTMMPSNAKLRILFTLTLIAAACTELPTEHAADASNLRTEASAIELQESSADGLMAIGITEFSGPTEITSNGTHGWSAFSTVSQACWRWYYKSVGSDWQLVKEGPQFAYSGYSRAVTYGDPSFELRVEVSPVTVYPPQVIWCDFLGIDDSATKSVVVNISTPPPPPLNAYFAGPEWVSPSDEGTWEIMPSGGTGSYGYGTWTMACESRPPEWVGWGEKSVTFTPVLIEQDCWAGFDLKVEVTSGSQTITFQTYVYLY